MARVIAIANQKGGVGKTTTAVNLPAALAAHKKKILVIDLDPQGNATSGLGVDKNTLSTSLYEVFLGEKELADILVKSVQENLLVAPANQDLVGAEIEINAREGRERILKEQISKLTTRFDYIFIDCPPSLGMMTVNALVAADSILVPLQCEYYALEGISALMQTVALAQDRLNPELVIEGILLTMHARTNLSRQVQQEAKNFFGKLLYKTSIPRNVRLSESPSFGKPITLYAARSPGAKAYKALAKEFDRRIEELEEQKEKKRAVG